MEEITAYKTKNGLLFEEEEQAQAYVVEQVGAEINAILLEKGLKVENSQFALSMFRALFGNYKSILRVSKIVDAFI